MTNDSNNYSTAQAAGQVPLGGFRGFYCNKTRTYEYHIEDHLGNVRVAFEPENNNKITLRNDYYPFGMQIQYNPFELPGTNKYLYNGKEMQDEFGLDWLDYGARFYDAEIGRWHVVDFEIEKHYDYTPYAYVYNNPTILIDPLGLDSIKIHVLASENNNLTQIINDAVAQMNKTYEELNVDLHVGWEYIESRDGIMSKDDFYSRDGAEEGDSYVVMSYDKDYRQSAKNMESKGWEKIWVENSENGHSAKYDYAAVINLDYALQTGYEFDSSPQKISIATQHETGHPKFIRHPSRRYFHAGKWKYPTSLGHVNKPYNIMHSNPGKNANYDAYETAVLQFLHGKRFYFSRYNY